ncbi:condensation domain-containing protein [Streptomyces sp. NPDC126514]|uniref:condensation domain-containing protein n=1 Tax=Streptomyces sp. NPDC126514 TaxID=3155210 RepID=UPI003317900F
MTTRTSRSAHHDDTVAAAPPLTAAQLALWAEEQISDTSNSGFFAVTLTGTVSDDTLRQAALAVLHRHQPLRSVLQLTSDGSVRQFVLPASQMLVFEAVRLPCPPGQERAAVRDWYTAYERPRRWNLAAEGPIRFLLLTHDSRRCSLVMSVHHAGFDGRSKFVVAQDFTTQLRHIRAGRPLQAEELPHAVPPSAPETTRKAAARYWSRTLPRLTEPLRMPETTTAAVRTVDSAGPAAIDPAHVEHLRKLARQHGVTTFTALVAALGLQLAAYGNRSIPLGVAADISAAHSREIAGVQINVVPTVLVVDFDADGRALLTAAKDAVERLHRFRHVPLADLAKRVQDKSAHRVMTQLGLSFPRAPEGLLLEVPGLDTRWDFFTLNTATTFERTLQIRAQWPQCRVRLDHRSESTGPAEATAFLGHFQAAVQRLVEQPAEKVSRFQLPAAMPVRCRADSITPRTRLVEAGAGTLAALIRLRALQAPRAVALVTDSGSVDHAQLAEVLLEGADCLALPGARLLARLAQAVSGRPEEAGSLRRTARSLPTRLAAGDHALWQGPLDEATVVEAVAAWQRGAVLHLLPSRPGAGTDGFVRVCAAPESVHDIASRAGRNTRELVVPMERLKPTSALMAWQSEGRLLGAHWLVKGNVAGWAALGASPVQPPRLTPAPGLALAVQGPSGRPLPVAVAGRITYSAETDGPPWAAPKPALTDVMGRMTPDGGMEYLAPHGHRWLRHHGFIETALVERVLEAHPAVRSAHVQLHQTPRGPVALATVETTGPVADTTVNTLRGYVREQLGNRDLPGRIHITSCGTRGR